jgi:hypothetical protein
VRAADRVSSPSASLSIYLPLSTLESRVSRQIDTLALLADAIQAPAEALPTPKAPQHRDDLVTP